MLETRLLQRLRFKYGEIYTVMVGRRHTRRHVAVVRWRFQLSCRSASFLSKPVSCAFSSSVPYTAIQLLLHPWGLPWFSRSLVYCLAPCLGQHTPFTTQATFPLWNLNTMLFHLDSQLPIAHLAPNPELGCFVAPSLGQPILWL